MGSPSNNNPQRLRFGLFEADLASGELYKRGRLIRVQEKPFRILAMLLERPGKVISREEVQKKLWPEGTFVDFDEGLDTALKKLRQALGDSSQNPVFVETVPRRGYRFVAAVADETDVDVVAATAPSSSPLAEPTATERTEQPVTRGFGRGWQLLATGGLVAAVLVGITIRVARQPSASAIELKQRQLTVSSSQNPVRYGAISPDGKYLAYADLKGIHITLIETGDTQNIPQPEAFKGNRVDWQNFRWFLDGTRFLVNQNPPPERANGYDASVWEVSLLGGAPRKLRDTTGVEDVSPDGTMVAFTTNVHDLWLMGPHGEQVHKVYELGEKSSAIDFRWAPSGNRLAYIKDQEGTIESRDLHGGTPTILLSDVKDRLQDYVWLPDGRIVYALAEPRPNNDTCNLWERRVDKATGQPHGQPWRLTNWAGFCVDNITASADGKRLAFEEWAGHASVYIADTQSNGKRIIAPSRLTLSDSWNVPSAWTPDSKAVVFSSRFNGQWEILEQRLHEDTAKPIVTGLASVSDHTPFSPDGSWILYTTRASNAQPTQVMRVPAIGGPPQLVMTGGSDGVRCTKSPETLCAIAERSPAATKLTFIAFDPFKGRGRELMKFDTSPGSDYSWDLSPDATRIAVLKNLTGQIHILSLTGQPTLMINVGSSSTSSFLDWAADGKGLFVSRPTPRGFALLSVDLHGHIHALWEQEGSLGISALPSPDGRHLAVRGWSVNSNIWMMENF